MSCGCQSAKSVVADTLRRDALARGGPLVEGEVCDRPEHAAQVARLMMQWNARPGLRLHRQLRCGCTVTIR